MEKLNESGRSLLETLATLAIMGLISAGGIVGYTRAMEKIRASRTVDRLMKRATDVSTQLLAGSDDPDLSNWNKNDGTYTISNDVSSADNDTAFTLTVEKVPKAVCERLLELQWPLATITPSKAEDCLEEADMTFTFNDDLTPRSGNGGGSNDNAGNNDTQPPVDVCDTCTTGQTCLTIAGEKKCVSECPSGVERDEETGLCADDACTDNSNCPSNKYCKVEVVQTGSNCARSNNTCTCSVGAGTCENIGTIVESGNYVYSEQYMNWDSAKNWCAAAKPNGKLITLNTLSSMAGGITFNYDSQNGELYFSDSKGNEPYVPLYSAFCGDTTPTHCLESDAYYVMGGDPGDSCNIWDFGTDTHDEAIEICLGCRDSDDAYALCE